MVRKRKNKYQKVSCECSVMAFRFKKQTNKQKDLSSSIERVSCLNLNFNFSCLDSQIPSCFWNTCLLITVIDFGYFPLLSHVEKLINFLLRLFLYPRNLDRTAMKTLCVLWAMRTVCSLRSLPCLFRSNNQLPSVTCVMSIRTHPAYLYNHTEFYVKQKPSCF